MVSDGKKILFPTFSYRRYITHLFNFVIFKGHTGHYARCASDLHTMLPGFKYKIINLFPSDTVPIDDVMNYVK